jgi:2-dehydropantoate 2-reductase
MGGCVRALPDVITTPKLIEPVLAASKTFVLIQNGVGIEIDLQQAAPLATIISACAWVDSTTVDGGKTVRQTGTVCSTWHTAGDYICLINDFL